MSALQLIAGETAKKRIKEHGLSPNLLRMIVGASGGPKWLVLKGIDRFLCHEFLPKADQKIDLVGSSIGAWRMTVYAHPEPGRIFDQFLEGYFSFRTEHAKTRDELTRVSYDILQRLFTEEETTRLLNNPNRNLNIVAVRGKGIAGSRQAWIEAIGILVSAFANAIDRKHLKSHFERAIFHSQNVANPEAWQGFDILEARLTSHSLADALMASGSIPFLSAPVIDIDGAEKGVYRDGGVIDYHFDVPWQYTDGIILYPHFYGHIVPGWFDKSKPARHAAGPVWDQMLMLAPTDEFVQTLPGGKITDRKDFTQMSDDERLACWNTVISMSEQLAEEFAELLDDHGKLIDSLQSAPGG